jgi:hypothetical protein
MREGSEPSRPRVLTIGSKPETKRLDRLLFGICQLSDNQENGLSARRLHASGVLIIEVRPWSRAALGPQTISDQPVMS